jgi:hypothetical protein
MITTPITPVTAAPASWLSVHAARIERVVIVSLVLLVTTYGLGRYFDARVAATEARATQAEQTLTAEKAQDTQNAAQVNQVTQQYTAMIHTLTDQNKALTASLGARQSALVSQKATDTHLTPTELSSRLGSLGNTPAGGVSVEQTGILLTQPAAVAVVQTLEEVPVLTSNLADQTTISSNFQAELVKANEVILDQTKQISGLNLTLTGETDTCKAQVAALTAKARRAKLRYFWVGVVAGFIGRSVIH